jgi:hypothetical protein
MKHILFIFAVLALVEFDNGNVRFEADYDEDTKIITEFRCINNTGSVAFGELFKTLDGIAHTKRFGPGRTFIRIPVVAEESRVQGFINQDGRLDGIHASLSWPVD